jgi:PST family polysaccharide transporter
LGGLVHSNLDGGVARRILSFGTSTLVTLLTPLFVLPVIAKATDASGWAALAIGQSIGVLLGLVVGLGWPVTGPVELARASRLDVATVFYESLLTRAGLLIAATVPAVVVAYIVSPAGRAGLVTATAVAFASMGLSSNWVAVGLGSVARFMLLESLPRLVVLLSAGLAIHFGASLYLYPAAIASASVAGTCLFVLFGVRPRRPKRRLAAMLCGRIRTQAAALATSLSAGAYSAGALLLVGLSTSVNQTAVMSSAQLIYGVGLYAIVALASAFQAWVVVADEKVSRARRIQAFSAHVILGVAGLAAYGLLTPLIARSLFGPELAPGHAVGLAYGAAFCAVSVGTSYAQHFLLPDGDVVGVLRATVVGAVVGVPAILVLAGLFGAPGGAAALALSEVVVAVTMALRANRRPAPAQLPRYAFQ